MNALASSTASASGTATAAPASGSAGKTTSSSGLPANQAAPPPSAATAVIPELKAHVGETFVDGGSYVWRVEADGSFVCVAQPPSAKAKSVGAKVKSTSVELWKDLCAMAIRALEPAAVPAPDAAPAPANSNTPAEPTGFSLEGFLTSLFSTGETLLDVGSQCVDLVTDLLGLGGEAPAVEPATPAPADPTATPTAPAPAPADPAAPAPLGDKQLSGAAWRSIADANGWPNSTSLGDLRGPFAAGAQTFVTGLTASGAHVDVVSTLRHDNRAALMHFSHTVGYGTETPQKANETCQALGIAIEWDHGDAAATKAAALALRAAFHVKAGVEPALHSRHCKGDAMDLKITDVPDQLTVGGQAYTAEAKTIGTFDEDKVDHIARDLGVIWRAAKDDVHWSSDGT